MIESLPENRYDAVVLAVAHREFKALKKEEEETGKDLSDQGSKLVVVELLELLDELL